ncbi:MAG: Rpp14/Pop5 family protein [Methanomicrobiales archaeon]|nr:Rpp14/Pop5 family protein [Methanomicrobiales archaeon]
MPSHLPSQRDRRRYLLCRTVPEWAEPGPRVVFQAVCEAITTLWGDTGAAEIAPAVLDCGRGYVVVRCRRGTESRMSAALATVTRAGEDRLALRQVLTSGTLHAIRRRMREPTVAGTDTPVLLEGRAFLARRSAGQKVDLIAEEKKSPELLFFTEDDGVVR